MKYFNFMDESVFLFVAVPVSCMIREETKLRYYLQSHIQPHIVDILIKM